LLRREQMTFGAIRMLLLRETVTQPLAILLCTNDEV
jgi:hypothetical protein